MSWVGQRAARRDTGPCAWHSAIHTNGQGSYSIRKERTRLIAAVYITSKYESETDIHTYVKYMDNTEATQPTNRRQFGVPNFPQ